MEPLSPYRKNKCWFRMRRQRKTDPEKFCGQYGELCEVYRPTEFIERYEGKLIGQGWKWGAVSSQKIEMYLCREHRTKVREAGYIVTKVTSELPDDLPDKDEQKV